MYDTPDLNRLSAAQLRALVSDLSARIAVQESVLSEQQSIIVDHEGTISDHESAIANHEQAITGYEVAVINHEQAIKAHQLREQQLSHEIALLRRYRFGRRSEGLNTQQRSLLDDHTDEDIAALEATLEKLSEATQPTPKKQQPKRQALPPELPRTLIHHEPDSTSCPCGCQMDRVGEDVSEKLDYAPGTFNVERHIRGKWACKACETLVQAPVAPHIIDKGIPTTNLLAQVLIAKYADHLPLYRQQQMYARAGVELPRSTLADWVGRCGLELAPLVNRLQEVLLQHDVLHADETPVSMLAPGQKRVHRAYVWAYATTRFAPIQGVVYDFRPTRSGKEARAFLESWTGKLVCDDFSGYKAGFRQGITEIGCMAHARRKFHELHESSHTPIAEKALQTIALVYDIEREVSELDAEARWRIRQERAKPILDQFHVWLIGQRDKVTSGTATAKAINYSLKRWEALVRYLDDGHVPIDNNWVENQIRPWALGRSNWLFAGSLRSGQRAANIMSLIQSAKINGLDPQAYLRDVMEQLPTAKQSQLDALLPHNWESPVNMG